MEVFQADAELYAEIVVKSLHCDNLDIENIPSKVVYCHVLE